MFGRNKKELETNGSIDAPDGIELFDLAGLQSESAALYTLANLFDVYQPGVVFSEPYFVDDHTVITASEVYVGMGLGFASGSGRGDEGAGEGGGGGGGGGSAGRPVAAIIVGPQGVRVEPIVDVTKIALAFFTTLGAMFFTWRAMRRRR
jgi:uncharacterized spore protein YtfJ